MLRSSLFIGLVTLAGCELLPGDYRDYGSMSASVRGALDLDLHGTALVYQYPDTANVELHLDITNDFARHISLETAGTEALRVDTYRLADGTLEAIEYEVDNRTERLFVGVSGELVIERIESDENNLFGTFAFEAVDEDGARVSVEGSFRARGQPSRPSTDS